MNWICPLVYKECIRCIFRPNAVLAEIVDEKIVSESEQMSANVTLEFMQEGENRPNS